MLEFLRPTAQKLNVLKKVEQTCWINAMQPSEEEIVTLKRLLPITDAQIDSLKDADQIPSIDEEREYSFIIAQTPFDDKKDKFGYRTVPIGIFVTKDKVATICFFPDDAAEQLKKDRFEFRKTQLVFRLLLSSARLYLKYLKEIRQKMYVVEGYLGSTIGNKHIMELIELEQSLTYFDTALRSNSILLQRLAKEEKTNKFIMVKTKEDEHLVEHMIDLSSQAIEVANVYSSILSNMLDAFTSIISNNLNNIIKVLTSVTIIIAVPTLIASIYGMNVALPLAQRTDAFMLVMLFSLLSSTAFLLILWKKRFI